MLGRSALGTPLPWAAGAARWQRQMLDALWRHRDMCFNPEYGRVGAFALPYFLLFEAAAPVIELYGYAWFAYALFAFGGHWPFVLSFVCLALLLGSFASCAAVLMEQITLHPYPRLRDWSGPAGLRGGREFRLPPARPWSGASRAWSSWLRGREGRDPLDLGAPPGA